MLWTQVVATLAIIPSIIASPLYIVTGGDRLRERGYPSTVEKRSASTGTYTVVSGDTGYIISSVYSITFGTLSNANPNVNWNALSIGQVLNMPSQRKPYAYTTVSGDTAASIANTYNVYSSDLTQANQNVDFNNMPAGTQLRVPGYGRYTTYTVTSGDSGDIIAAAEGITFSSLSNANPGVNWNNLQVGQVLQVPAGVSPTQNSLPSPATAPVSSTTAAATTRSTTASTAAIVRGSKTTTTTTTSTTTTTTTTTAAATTTTTTTPVATTAITTTTTTRTTTPTIVRVTRTSTTASSLTRSQTTTSATGAASSASTTSPVATTSPSSSRASTSATVSSVSTSSVVPPTSTRTSTVAPTTLSTTIRVTTTTTTTTAATTAATTPSVTGSNAVPSVNNNDGRSDLSDSYTFYTGDGSASAGWPQISDWASFQLMWDRVKPFIGQSCQASWNVANNSPTETQQIYDAIQYYAGISKVDHRLILATILQESSGCVRVPTTNNGVRNPGLMQDYNGVGTCNENGNIQNPCPQQQIYQMVADGVLGTTTQSTSPAGGLVQDINSQNAAGYSGSQAIYRASRLYNAGSIPSSDLGAPGATRCYVSDIANRLRGWVIAGSKCTYT